MTLRAEETVVGFVGTGVMGKSMAKHFLQAGYTVLIYTRTKAKAQELLDAGAVWKEQVSELAAQADVIITMVGYPSDVEEVYLGADGIIAHAKPGTYLVDMTTSKPSLAQKIYEEAKQHSLYSLDAPVSGGDVGAREARLTIMVGGDQEAFEAVEPLLAIMGKNVVLQGGPGAGQHTKMCNQICIATNMIGVCEAIAYAKLVAVQSGSAHDSRKFRAGLLHQALYQRHGDCFGSGGGNGAVDSRACLVEIAIRGAGRKGRGGQRDTGFDQMV